jgi:hypothetical protein
VRNDEITKVEWGVQQIQSIIATSKDKVIRSLVT